MVCIYCSSRTQVTNSRLQKRANQVWRRRLCLKCGSNFTTHEIPEYGSTVSVRYSSKELQPFSRDLLFVSIYESCKHRKSALEDAHALTQTIIAQLLQLTDDGLLDRDVITTIARTVLDRFDTAAGTMYAAYHPVK